MNNGAYVGIVGLGRMGKRHLEAYLRNRDVTVGACCDTNSEALKFLDSRQLQCRRYTDWRQMLKEESFDLLSVVTNAPTHAEITIEAARRKVPRVICEKPMATSIRDAMRMIEATEAAGTLLSINYSRRWSDNYRKLRQLIESGAIGDLCEIYCVMGGGLLACNGSHFFDTMRFLTDSEPTSVIGFIDRRGSPNPRGPQFTDPGAFGVLRFYNGTRGFLDMCEDLGVPPKVEIVGSIGRITIDDSSNSWLVESREGRDRTERLGKYDLPLVSRPFPIEPIDVVKLAEKAINEMLHDERPSCGGADGLAALHMIMGFHISDREGNIPTELPLPAKYHEFAVNFT